MCYEDSGYSKNEIISIPQTQVSLHNLSLLCFRFTYGLYSPTLLSFGIAVDSLTLHGRRIWFTIDVPCCREADATKKGVATLGCWNILPVVGMGNPRNVVLGHARNYYGSYRLVTFFSEQLSTTLRLRVSNIGSKSTKYRNRRWLFGRKRR